MINIYQCWIEFGCCYGERTTGHGGLWLTKKSAERDLKTRLKYLVKQGGCVIINNGVSTLKVCK